MPLPLLLVACTAAVLVLLCLMAVAGLALFRAWHHAQCLRFAVLCAHLHALQLTLERRLPRPELFMDDDAS